MLFLVLVLIVAILTVVFAVANMTTVPISLLVTKETLDVPIVLIVVVALLLGMLITYLGMLPAYIRGKRTISGQRKKISGLEKSVAEQTGKVEQLQQKLNPPPAPPVADLQSPVESSGNSIDPVI